MASQAADRILFIEHPPEIVRKGDLFFIQAGPASVCCTPNVLLQFATAADAAIKDFQDTQTVTLLYPGAVC